MRRDPPRAGTGGGPGGRPYSPPRAVGSGRIRLDTDTGARPDGDRAAPGVAVTLRRVIRLDAATVLLQWAVGGMAFCWFTTRRRQVGLGYGWLLRGIYLLMAVGAFAAGLAFGVGAGPRGLVARRGRRRACSVLVVSVVRRRAGVSGQRAEHDRRTARVAAMTGIDRAGADEPAVADGARVPPVLDLVPVAVGCVGLVAAALDAGGNTAVSLLRTFAGAAFLGAVTDAMLLGHWYLVQPGLPRGLLNELVDALGWVWPIEVLALLLPTGMISVWTGAVDDGWNGTLGWFWAACAVDDDRARRRHQGGAARAGVLGGDGRHRPALPRHPHRVRHRPRRPRRARRLTAAPERIGHRTVVRRISVVPCPDQCGAGRSASA